MGNKMKLVWTVLFLITVFVFNARGVFANGTASGVSIQTGWDSGVSNVADTYGDLVVSYRTASGGADIFATPASFVSSTVSSVYGNTLPVSYTPQTVMPGDTVWFLLTVTNKGNSSDTITFSTQNFNYYGMGADSIIVTYWNSAKTAQVTNTSLLAEDASEQFNVAVYFLNGLDHEDSMTFEVKTISKGGLGGDTEGYVGANLLSYAGNGDDTILLSATVYSLVAQIYVSKSVTLDNTGLTDYDGDTSLVVPGSVLVFDITYDNDGTGEGDTVTIVTYIPANTDIDTATAAMCSPDTNNNASSITIQFSNDGSSWHSTALSTDNRIKWILGNAVSTQDNDEGTDTQGAVDGTVQDADSGRLQYKVIVR
ncbi:hypothetical protein KA977_02860 [Candidatus Dependentiae bacterium]|nr:hypothetical protein [Candidatus Dependentiae bacterium]